MDGHDVALLPHITRDTGEWDGLGGWGSCGGGTSWRNVEELPGEAGGLSLVNDAYLNAVVELYAAAEALCDLDDEMAIAAHPSSDENELGDALARLRAALDECDRTGMVLTMTHIFQNVKVEES